MPGHFALGSLAGCVSILLPGIVLSIRGYQREEKEASGVSVQTG